MPILILVPRIETNGDKMENEEMCCNHIIIIIILVIKEGLFSLYRLNNELINVLCH